MLFILSYKLQQMRLLFLSACIAFTLTAKSQSLNKVVNPLKKFWRSDWATVFNPTEPGWITLKHNDDFTVNMGDHLTAIANHYVLSKFENGVSKSCDCNRITEVTDFDRSQIKRIPFILDEDIYTDISTSMKAKLTAQLAGIPELPDFSAEFGTELLKDLRTSNFISIKGEFIQLGFTEGRFTSYWNSIRKQLQDPTYMDYAHLKIYPLVLSVSGLWYDEYKVDWSANVDIDNAFNVALAAKYSLPITPELAKKIASVKGSLESSFSMKIKKTITEFGGMSITNAFFPKKAFIIKNS